ncbi:HdeD family acid-resistance protein [Cellulosimicrobium sp. NPDC055967]|uniref:HdeD family acid-resistance protein n=1 Tax=Cellulosimicrobium sp. NPDC055967 TaxID=3345670 RepID=UPI0035DBFEE2
MSTNSGTIRTVNGIRTAVGVSGLVSAILGVLILVWPGRTAMVVTAIVAAYAIIAGLVHLGLGLFSGGKGGWARVGRILLGVVFIVAGVLAFLNLGQTTTFLALFLGILVGILWIVEGIVDLTSLRDAASKTISILFAILSIVAGVVLLLTPLWGVTVLWWLLGLSLIVLGLVNIVRGFRYGTVRA